MTGGLGHDRFRFDRKSDSPTLTKDVVKDFHRGEDKIDLSLIDADQDGTIGNQKFIWIGAREFTGRDGELRFAGGYVSGDVNGDGTADFSIRVAGPSLMTASDFVL